MNPEDEKRLAEIREFSTDGWRTSQHDVRWLLAKLDDLRAQLERAEEARRASL